MRFPSCVILAVLLGWGHGLWAGVIYSVTDVGTLGGSGTATEFTAGRQSRFAARSLLGTRASNTWHCG
jgi:hypothetical protein